MLFLVYFVFFHLLGVALVVLFLFYGERGRKNMTSFQRTRDKHLYHKAMAYYIGGANCIIFSCYAFATALESILRFVFLIWPNIKIPL